MKKHFITFYSPGTFVAEQSTKEIDSWDVERAKKMANEVSERYGATPYGFRFSTRERGEHDLDSTVTKTSPMHYMNCKVETLDEIEARNDPKDEILRSNMRCNGYDKVVRSVKGWAWAQPLLNNDVVL